MRLFEIFSNTVDFIFIKPVQIWIRLVKIEFYHFIILCRYAISTTASKSPKISCRLKISSGAFSRLKNFAIWATRIPITKTNYKSKIFFTMQSKNVSTFWRSRQVLDYNDQNTKSQSCNKSLYTLTNKEIIPSPSKWWCSKPSF